MNRNQLKKLLNDPMMGLYFLRSRMNKEAMFRAYSRKTIQNGIKGLWFVLSFDCDTEEDFDVVEEINQRLIDLNIKAVYAVPGELLMKGIKPYSEIAKTGVSFINHGYKVHTVRSAAGTYSNALEYEKLTLDERELDIRLGHEFLLKEFGILTRGFRTPHFGKMQSRGELKGLYSILDKLNYTYSTSTIPYYGYRYGAVYKNQGLLEIPISGMIDEPLRIQDSFLFWDNSNGRFDGKGYFEAGMRTLSFIQTLNDKEPLNGVLNLYADPSQIAGDSYFYELMKNISELCNNTNYDQLIEMVEANRG